MAVGIEEPSTARTGRYWSRGLNDMCSIKIAETRYNALRQRQFQSFGRAYRIDTLSDSKA